MLLVITFYLNMRTLEREERSCQIILRYISRQLDKSNHGEKDKRNLHYIIIYSWSRLTC